MNNSDVVTALLAASSGIGINDIPVIQYPLGGSNTKPNPLGLENRPSAKTLRKRAKREAALALAREVTGGKV